MRLLRTALALLLPFLGVLLAATPAGASNDLLLVPDSANARIMAFDAAGQIVDLDYIVNPAFELPIHAIGAGDQILVSDQDADLVHHFDASDPTSAPMYEGAFTPVDTKGDADPALLDNVRGIAKYNGRLLVAVGGAQSQFRDGIVRFTDIGTLYGNGLQVAPGLGGLDSPFGVLVDVDHNRLLVSGGTSQRIHAYELLPRGAAMPDLAFIDGFPEQVAIASSVDKGNILVAVFSGNDRGILEFSGDGSGRRLIVPRLDNVLVAEGFRGVAELDNPEGDLLVTTTRAVYVVRRTDGAVLSTPIESDDTTTVSPRFVGRCNGPLGTTLLDFHIE